MDPDANLREQISIAQSILDGNLDKHLCARLCELVLALNDWLAKGGAHPKWKEVWP